MPQEQEIKYCQSCIQRGFNPPQPAVREWQVGIYYCEECFGYLLQNMLSTPQASVDKVSKDVSNFTEGPILDKIYELYEVPKELQFDNVDTVCRNYDKIFNFYAPAVINRSLDNLAVEHEQLAISLFHIKYKIETLDMMIKKLKEERRKEKGLKDIEDSKEAYAKGKPPKVKQSAEEKLAAAMGLTMEEYQAKMKAARMKEFNKLAGNCPECGGSLPCIQHP